MVNEDDELLTELRVISSKFSSADKFGSTKNDEVCSSENETLIPPCYEK